MSEVPMPQFEAMPERRGQRRDNNHKTQARHQNVDSLGHYGRVEHYTSTDWYSGYLKPNINPTPASTQNV